MATIEGDERVKILVRTATMTKDMLRILSNFETRFCSMTQRLRNDADRMRDP